MQSSYLIILPLLRSYGFWVIFLLGLGNMACLSKKGNDTTQAKQVSVALAQMAKEFKGNHSVAYIRQEVNQAFKMYEVTINEANYQRCVQILIALRKASQKGVTEMDILAHVKAINARAYGVSFFKQLAASARYLEKKPLDLSA